LRSALVRVTRATAQQPELPRCKRCGKPCPTPAHEYCGAACSAQRHERPAAELAAQQPELPKCVREFRANTTTWSQVRDTLNMGTVHRQCLDWLATASPAAIVAAASSEDVDTIEGLRHAAAVNRGTFELNANEQAALSRATIVDPATHVVLPRAEVEEWIVGLRSYNDDCMFDYMPPALRELLEKST
jgi:hypothetical protein